MTDEADAAPDAPETLGHYRLLEVLGEGGMGRVYLAEDTKLGRRVALKVLPPETAKHPERLARFEREAKAVAALNHPNIVTIHSIEEADGRPFLTMERAHGTTLGQAIPPDGFPLERLFPLAIALADALSAAHQQGIIHRDLKPENVMVSAEGRLKVLDFGLAKLREDSSGGALDTEARTATVTQDGRILGTVAYMSPEQAQGQRVDDRSDIFSLGILLYEMATGERPFRGATNISVLSAILKDTPAPVSDLKQQLPRALARMITRALEKNPNDRYQSALDLRNDLEDLKRDVDTGELIVSQCTQPGMRVPRLRDRSRWPLVAGLAAAILVLPLWFGLRGAQPDVEPAVLAAAALDIADMRPSLAVFYFDNISDDSELDWLRAGLTDMLVTDLSQSPNLRIVGTTRLYQLLEAMDRLDTPTSFDVVQAVAQEANVTTALIGSFVRSGEMIRISARLQDTVTGDLLASERVEGRGEEALFSMVDDLTDRIRLRFELPQDTADGGRELREVTTSSLQAYRAYVEGFRLHEKLDERAAQPHFEEALEHDPDFAMALAKLAVVHSNLGEMEQAKEYSQRALALVDNLPGRERYYIEGFHYSLSPDTADRSLEAYSKAVQFYPDHSAARHNLAQQLTYRERYDEAIRHLEHLRRQGMPFPSTYESLAEAYVGVGQVPQALSVLEEFARRNPKSARGQVALGNFLTGMGRFDGADEALSAAERLAPDLEESQRARWRLDMLRGNRKEAAQLVARMATADEPRKRWASLAASALDQAYSGHVDEALEDLREARTCEPDSKYGTALISAALLLDLGRCDEAGRMAERFLESENRYPADVFDAHLLRAVCHARSGDSRAADAAFVEAERALERIPEPRREALLARMSGFVALASNDPREAVRHLSRAARSRHPSPMRDDAGAARIWFALGAAQLELKDSQAAEKWLHRLADSRSERLTAPVPWVRSQYLLAQIYDERGDTARAREHYARFLEYWEDGEVDRERVADARTRLDALS